MAFGDVLAGFAQASHEHNVNLLQMDYQNRRTAAEMLGKIAESPDYPQEARAWAAQAALHHLNFSEKIPKEFDVSKGIRIPVSTPTMPGPQQPQPGGAAPGTPGAPLGMPAPEIPPPQPPPGMMDTQLQNPLMPFSPEQLQAIQQRGLVSTLGAHREAEQQDIVARHNTIKSIYPEMDPEVASMLALKMPIASMLGTSATNDVPGSQITTLTHDAFNNPIDRNAPYTVMRNKLGQPVSAYPKENPVVGGLKFGQIDNKWVAFTVDKYPNANGNPRIHIQADLGITPPQGVPITSYALGQKIAPTPDGGYELVTTPTETTRVRGGEAAAPTAPSTVAPNTAPVAAPTAPSPAQTTLNKTTAPAAAPTPPSKFPPVGAPGSTRKIPGAGRPLTPIQMENNQKATAAFDNMISRMSGVLANADKFSSLATRLKIRLATDPNHEGRLLVASALKPLNSDESTFAADYLSLGEDINLLRGVFQATGFRGPEAFAVQQAQRGLLSGDFGLFKKTLQNSLKASVDQLSAINKAMTRAGQPVPLTAGIKRAYMLLNNGNSDKAVENALNDGWQLQ